MAFSLSFSDAFYTGTEPLDDIEPSTRPTNVYQAIVSLREEVWRELASDIFGVDAGHLTIEEVFDRVRQTNTCTDLSPPAEVWIDEVGDYRLLIYEPLSQR